MMTEPSASCTALVGSGAELLPASVLVKYSKTIRLLDVTSRMRLCDESVINVSPLGSRLANAAALSPWSYCHTMVPARVISMTRLLFSSPIRMLPVGSSSALLGLLSAPGPDLGPYDQTTCLLLRSTSMTRLLAWSTIMILRLGNWMANTGTFNSLGPEPVTPACPYCHTMSPFWLTTMTRLSAQPLGSLAEPAGMPVPASKVRPPLNRSASLRPMIAPGPGLQRVGLPEPKVQTICPSGATSTARLLNWSEMRRLPGALKCSFGVLDGA